MSGDLTGLCRSIFALSELSCVLGTNENMGLCLYMKSVIKYPGSWLNNVANFIPPCEWWESR